MIRKSFTKLNNTSPLLGLAISIASIFLLFYAFRKLVSHNSKIRKMQQKHNKFTKLPATKTRIISVIVFFIISIILFWLVGINPYKWETLKQITIGEKSIISLITLMITAPIVFIIWVFRDKNKLLELENARKDTNLKEFQQLQRWATGNIDGDNKDNKDNKGNKVALQISALHSLRAYLKGEYGESFRRGAYEIFRVMLATQHQKILEKTRKYEFKDIKSTIDNCQLTKQLNTIVSEEWFNLLINHNFPTKGISLVGVDLSRTYLHHRIYGKTLDLHGAQLQEANLEGAQLQEVNLKEAQLQRANLKETQLQGAILYAAQLQEANLFETQLQKANLESVQLKGSLLREVQLQEANLKKAQLQGVVIINSQLQEADLSEANLQRASLRFSHLRGADLGFSYLEGANLEKVQLQGVNLGNARLQGANLKEAQLQGANLCDTQLQGTNFEGAQLQGVKVFHWNEGYGQLDFKSKIKQQIDKETDVQNLKNQYKALSDGDKEKLINTLNKIPATNDDTMSNFDPIECIQSAQKTLDLSKAITGKYSKKEAKKWLNTYKEVVKDNDF